MSKGGTHSHGGGSRYVLNLRSPTTVYLNVASTGLAVTRIPLSAGMWRVCSTGGQAAGFISRSNVPIAAIPPDTTTSTGAVVGVPCILLAGTTDRDELLLHVTRDDEVWFTGTATAANYTLLFERLSELRDEEC